MWCSHWKWIHFFIHIHQKTELSINQRLDKQTVIHSQNGIILSNKKKWTTDIGNNLDDSPKHYVAQKKQDAKDGEFMCIFHDSIYVIFKSRQKLIYSNRNQNYSSLCVGKERIHWRGESWTFWGNENVLYIFIRL